MVSGSLRLATPSTPMGTPKQTRLYTCLERGVSTNRRLSSAPNPRPSRDPSAFSPRRVCPMTRVTIRAKSPCRLASQLTTASGVPTDNASTKLSTDDATFNYRAGHRPGRPMQETSPRDTPRPRKVVEGIALCRRLTLPVTDWHRVAIIEGCCIRKRNLTAMNSV